jgi:hypothetical protein
MNVELSFTITPAMVAFGVLQILFLIYVMGAYVSAWSFFGYPASMR